jgi:hypothetical protein
MQPALFYSLHYIVIHRYCLTFSLFGSAPRAVNYSTPSSPALKELIGLACYLASLGAGIVGIVSREGVAPKHPPHV